MINPIRATDQKIFNEQQNLRLNPNQTPSITENGVDKSASPTTYVNRKDDVKINYDVDRYVQILKNMVIPPSDRFDASILLELELNSKATAQDIKQMISEVERKEKSKVTSAPADTDNQSKDA